VAALVQSKTGYSPGGSPILTVTLDSAPTVGNVLVLMAAVDDDNGPTFAITNGSWTQVGSTVYSGNGTNWPNRMYYQVVGTATVAATQVDSSAPVETGTLKIAILELSGVDTLDADVASATNTATTTDSVTPTAGQAAIAVSATFVRNAGTGVLTPAGGMTELAEVGTTRVLGVNYRVIASTTGSYTLGSNGAAANSSMIGGIFRDTGAGGGTITADFTGTPLAGVAPLTVQFTDTSAGTPTAWSWDFGDGGAAGTAQNPSHQYTVPGLFTVSLTATFASGTAVETKPGYVLVNSSGVVFGDDFLEIPTGDIGSWRITRSGGPAGLGEGYNGAATITLINRANRYNPENESSDIIDHLRDGTRVWIGVNEDGTVTPDAAKDVYGLFAGRITEITVLPSPGTDVPSHVEFVCEDPLSWIDRAPVAVSTSTHRSHQQLRTDILEGAGESEYDLDDESITMPLSYADGNAGSLLDDLNKATGSRHFARPADDPDSWYEYVSVQRMAGLGGVASGTVNAGTQHVTDTSGWRTSADTVRRAVLLQERAGARLGA
jgi:PKD repeat protein